MARRLNSVAGRHKVGLLLLVLAVLVVHGYMTWAVGERLVSAEAQATMPARMDVAYVREMALAAPPAAVAAAPPPAPRARTRPRAVPAEPAASEPATEPAGEALPAQSAVSTPEPAAPPPEVIAEPAVPATPALAEASAPAPSDAAAAVAALPPASAASAGVEAFQWPASTRLSYSIKGYLRGDLDGDAQVEWVHQGAHYQVHMDLVIGPSFAPLWSRRMTSDGEITAQGLRPRRYDEEQKFMVAATRRAGVQFEPDAIVLTNGERLDAVADVQDQTSQFVQFSFLFGTRADLLHAGATIELPVALPRRVKRLVYEVRDQATVFTSFGELTTWHVAPRGAVVSSNELAVEVWLAPQLRYLPVKIRLTQGEAWFDLLVARRPELAAQ